MRQMFNFKVFLGDHAPVVHDKPMYTEKRANTIMRHVARVLLCAYTLMLCRPAVPILTDAVAHTFWESEHMLVVHEEHGKFHVHYETAKTGNSTEKDKQSNNSKTATEDSLYTSATLVFNFPAYHTLSDHNTVYIRNYAHYDMCVAYPPPKA